MSCVDAAQMLLKLNYELVRSVTNRLWNYKYPTIFLVPTDVKNLLLHDRSTKNLLLQKTELINQISTLLLDDV